MKQKKYLLGYFINYGLNLITTLIYVSYLLICRQPEIGLIKTKQKMNKKRCSWCVGDPIYEAYHDKEWGRDVREDSTLFEFLILA